MGEGRGVFIQCVGLYPSATSVEVELVVVSNVLMQLLLKHDSRAGVAAEV